MSMEDLYPLGLCDLEPACFLAARRLTNLTTELNSVTSALVDSLPNPTEAFSDPSPETMEAAEQLAYTTEQRHEAAKAYAKLIHCGTCPLIEVCKQLQGE